MSVAIFFLKGHAWGDAEPRPVQGSAGHLHWRPPCVRQGEETGWRSLREDAGCPSDTAVRDRVAGLELCSPSLQAPP
jgi:hypothetical protein